MSKPRKKYTKEEKLEVVKLSLEDNESLKELADRFEVSENTIYNWRSKYLKNKEASFSGKGNKTMTGSERKIHELEKELRETWLERDILKCGGHLFKKRQEISQFIMEYANEFPVKKVSEVFEVSRATYGSPRVHQALQKKEVEISENTVARRMKSLKITPKTKKRFKNTTDSKHGLKISRNLLNREFTVTELGRVWVSDITYIPLPLSAA